MAKIAILSDVHANAEAFEAVLGKCADLGIDSFVSLGDIVGYNAEPARCIAMARELNFMAGVRGNHDEYTISGNTEAAGFNANATKAILWTRQQLTSEDIDYLDSFAYRTVVPKTGVTIVHATLDSPENWGYIFDSLHAAANFSYQFTQVCFCGHSHIPVAFDKVPVAVSDRKLVEVIPGWAGNINYPYADADFTLADELPVSLEKGHKYLFNIGSIGQPRNGDPRASFAVLDTEKNTVTRYRMPYNVAAVQEKILAAGLPERLAERLALGR